MNRKEYKKLQQKQEIMAKMKEQPYSEHDVIMMFIVVLCIAIATLLGWTVA